MVFGARSSSEISWGSRAQRRALVPIMTVRPPRSRETMLVPMWVSNSTDRPTLQHADPFYEKGD